MYASWKHLVLVSQELFERKLIVDFLFIILRNGSLVKGLVNIIPDESPVSGQ